MNILRTFLYELLSFIKLFLIAIIIIIPIKYFFIEPYLVQGASMSPNYETGHYLIVNKLKTTLSKVKRGDILVFIPPEERSESLWKYSVYFDPRVKYIKRVIALPGETIKFYNRNAYVKIKGSNDFKLLTEPYIKFKGIRTNRQLTLKDDEYFMMGDNRPNSKDSRIIGPIKKSDIIGEPIIRLYPFSKVEFYPSRYIYKY